MRTPAAAARITLAALPSMAVAIAWDMETVKEVMMESPLVPAGAWLATLASGRGRLAANAARKKLVRTYAPRFEQMLDLVAKGAIAALAADIIAMVPVMDAMESNGMMLAEDGTMDGD